MMISVDLACDLGCDLSRTLSAPRTSSRVPRSVAPSRAMRFNGVHDGKATGWTPLMFAVCA